MISNAARPCPAADTLGVFDHRLGHEQDAKPRIGEAQAPVQILEMQKIIAVQIADLFRHARLTNMQAPEIA